MFWQLGNHGGCWAGASSATSKTRLSTCWCYLVRLLFHVSLSQMIALCRGTWVHLVPRFPLSWNWGLKLEFQSVLMISKTEATVRSVRVGGQHRKVFKTRQQEQADTRGCMYLDSYPVFVIHWHCHRRTWQWGVRTEMFIFYVFKGSTQTREASGERVWESSLT